MTEDSETSKVATPTKVTLALLAAIDADEAVTQRSLSTRLGVALGLTNAVLRRLVRKGLVKIKTAPARRYLYYVTPKGMKEKGYLVAEYLRESLEFFRQARREYAELMDYCIARGWHRIALSGARELTEIALLAAYESQVSVVAVIDPLSSGSRTFMGVPVVRGPEEMVDLDAVLMSDMDAPQDAYERLCATFDKSRILAPAILHLSLKDEHPVDPE